MMSFIDTHYHLDKYQNHSDMFSMINTLKQYTLCVTTTPGIFLSCRKLYSETKYVRFALGSHPLEITNAARAIFEFDHCLPQARYIGEVGLDYSRKDADRTSQLLVFDHIMRVQAKVNIPASIHIRCAEQDAIDIFSRYPNSKRIIHWFTGSNEQLHDLLSLGCYFSINSAMLKTEKQIQQLKAIPLERLLIESDGPYTHLNRKIYAPNMLEDIYALVSRYLCLPTINNIVFCNFRQLIQT